MRKFALGTVALLAWLAIFTVPHVHAQVYPTRPITIVVPYPPGGPTDVVARVIAERIRGPLGQTVIVENVSGGSGNVGVGRVARAAADGYTLSLGNNGSHVLNGALYQLPYDLLKDFAPIALLTSNPEIIVTRKTMPAKDLKELIAWFKANAGKATVGSAGAVALVSATDFQRRIGAKYVIVPYRGAAPALQDLMGGQIDLMFDQLSNALPQVRAGAVKAYAITAKARAANAPEIPSADESGLPGFYASLWQGLWAPKGTPPEIIATLNKQINAAVSDATIQKRLTDLGATPMPPMSPAEFGKLMADDYAKWAKVIKSANIKPL
jgi:tripartite-type tricarboxylate transporter receptor subunit TctC